MVREARPATVHLRFRDAPANQPDIEPEIEREATGFPKHWRARAIHSAARTRFMETMEREKPDEWMALVKHYDRNDPGFFVEWQRRQDA